MKSKVKLPKRAYTKAGQPFTAADVRALEEAIDWAANQLSEDCDEVIAARQALRNARELRSRLVRDGSYYLTNV